MNSKQRSFRSIALSVSAVVVIGLAGTGDSLALGRSHRWRTDVYACSGFAPLERGCTVQTTLGGALPGGQPGPGTSVHCNGEHPVYPRDFRGTLEIDIRGATRGFKHVKIECQPGGTWSICPCDFSWSAREPITITITADGVGPWAAEVKVLRLLVPDRPENMRARRDSGILKIVFEEPHPNESTIRGYEVRCRGPQNLTVSSPTKRPPLKVRGLAPHRGYVCRVRADSTNGGGFWSRPIRV